MHHEKNGGKNQEEDLMGKNDKKKPSHFLLLVLTSILHIFAEAILTIKIREERQEPKIFRIISP